MTLMGSVHGEKREKMPKLIDADKINAYLQKNSVNHTLTDIDAQ